MKLSKKDREKVNSLIDNAMNAPADDETVAMVFEAYVAGVEAKEIERDSTMEAEFRAHLKGTKFEKQFQ